MTQFLPFKTMVCPEVKTTPAFLGLTLVDSILAVPASILAVPCSLFIFSVLIQLSPQFL
jgi:hypothetical protein